MLIPLRTIVYFGTLELDFCLLVNLSREKVLLQIIVNTFNEAKNIMFTSFDKYVQFCYCCQHCHQMLVPIGLLCLS